MADSIISRKARDFDITLTTATASATTLDMRDVAGAILSLGTMSMAILATFRRGGNLPMVAGCSAATYSARSAKAGFWPGRSPTSRRR